MARAEKKVIIIEDDKELNGELSEILSDEGFIVESAYDGLKGMQLMQEKFYHLAILDLKMPVMGGIEILEELKKAKSPTKVVVITGNPMVINEYEKNIPYPYQGINTEILKLADDIINKPFDIEDFVNRIIALLI